MTSSNISEQSFMLRQRRIFNHQCLRALPAPLAHSRDVHATPRHLARRDGPNAKAPARRPCVCTTQQDAALRPPPPAKPQTRISVSLPSVHCAVCTEQPNARARYTHARTRSHERFTFVSRPPPAHRRRAGPARYCARGPKQAHAGPLTARRGRPPPTAGQDGAAARAIELSIAA